MRSVDDNTTPIVGWKFISWSGTKVACNVPACSRLVNAGHVRVDNANPYQRGFLVVCEDCWFKIMVGVDPGGDPLPEWERERREATDPDR